MTADEFLRRVSELLDPEDILDILGLDSKDLVNLIPDTILEDREKLEEYLPNLLGVDDEDDYQ